MNKIGEVEFPKRLYQTIETSILYKMTAFVYILVFFASIYICGVMFIESFILAISNNFDISSLSTMIFFLVVLLIGIYIGKLGFVSIIFLLSPLKFKFYEEGIAINNYFVKREHVLGYKKENGALNLFIVTIILTRGSPIYKTTQISMTIDDETKKLIAYLDKYRVPSDYAPTDPFFYKKINFNVAGQQSLFPPK